MKSSAALTLLVILSLSACERNGRAPEARPDSFCAIARPIYFEPSDRMSARTERAIIAQNEKGAALCGW